MAVGTIARSLRGFLERRDLFNRFLEEPSPPELSNQIEEETVHQDLPAYNNNSDSSNDDADLSDNHSHLPNDDVNEDPDSYWERNGQYLT